MLPGAAAPCADHNSRSSGKRTSCRSNGNPFFVFILCTYEEKQNENETKGGGCSFGLLSHRLSSKVSSCPFSCRVAM